MVPVGQPMQPPPPPPPVAKMPPARPVAERGSPAVAVELPGNVPPAAAALGSPGTPATAQNLDLMKQFASAAVGSMHAPSGGGAQHGLRPANVHHGSSHRLSRQASFYDLDGPRGLRAELSSLKLSELQSRARQDGATADRIEQAENGDDVPAKQALIELIVALRHDQNGIFSPEKQKKLARRRDMLSSYEQLGTQQLLAEAENEAGIDQSEVQNAMESERPRVALIELLVACKENAERIQMLGLSQKQRSSNDHNAEVGDKIEPAGEAGAVLHNYEQDAQDTSVTVGKGCYFLVFVQLFEKYGTLIERYTALIEKLSALIVLPWQQVEMLQFASLTSTKRMRAGRRFTDVDVERLNFKQRCGRSKLLYKSGRVRAGMSLIGVWLPDESHSNDHHIFHPVTSLEQCKRLLAEACVSARHRVHGLAGKGKGKAKGRGKGAKYATPSMVASRYSTAVTMTFAQLGDVVGHQKPMCQVEVDSSFSQAWDLLSVIFLVYVALLVPLRIAYDINVDALSISWWIELVVDVFFICDVPVNLNRVYVDPELDVIVTSPKEIRRHYMRGWMAIDVLSSLPISYVILLIETLRDETAKNDIGSEFKALKVIRLLRLAKLLRVAKIKQLMARYNDLVSRYLFPFKILALCFGVAGILHMQSCLLYYLGDHPDAFIETFFVGNPRFMVTNISSADIRLPQSTAEISLADKYPRVFRHAVRMLKGRGDIPMGLNFTVEILYEIILELFGAMLFGLVIGAVGPMVLNRNPATKARDDEISTINGFLKMKNVPKMLRRRIRIYMQHLLESSDYDREVRLMAMLPYDLSMPLMKFIRLDRFKDKFPDLGNLLAGQNGDADKALLQICLRLKPMYVPPGETVFDVGDPARELFFVSDGVVRVTRPLRPDELPQHDALTIGNINEVPQGEFSSGMIFGVDAVPGASEVKQSIDMNDVDMNDGADCDSLADLRRDRKATAVEESNVQFITSESLKTLMVQFPRLRVALKTMVMKILRTMKKQAQLNQKMLRDSEHDRLLDLEAEKEWKPVYQVLAELNTERAALQHTKDINDAGDRAVLARQQVRVANLEAKLAAAKEKAMVTDRANEAKRAREQLHERTAKLTVAVQVIQATWRMKMERRRFHLLRVQAQSREPQRSIARALRPYLEQLNDMQLTHDELRGQVRELTDTLARLSHRTAAIVEWSTTLSAQLDYAGGLGGLVRESDQTRGNELSS